NGDGHHGNGPSGHDGDGDPGNGRNTDTWPDDSGVPWRGKETPWVGKGAPWGGKRWAGGKGPSPWDDKHAAPWSRTTEVYGETVTVIIDRRTAENVYSALATALGGVDWPEPTVEWSRKGHHHKGHAGGGGKKPPAGAWSAESWSPDPWT